jgi:hypothetical protein
MIEVTGGLAEGEMVALDPPNVIGPVGPLRDFDELDGDEPAQTATIAAAHH